LKFLLILLPIFIIAAMKNITIFLIVFLLISLGINAQQVNPGSSNDAFDSTILKTDENGTEQITPMVAPDFPIKTTANFAAKTEGGKDPKKAEPTDLKTATNAPMMMKIIPGTIGFVLGSAARVLTNESLNALGITTFDGKEIVNAVYTPGEGYIHYILNPNWKGVLKIWEHKVIEGQSEVKGKQQVIQTTDGSLVIPSTFVSDKDGCTAWLSNKGFGYSYGKGEYKGDYYYNLTQYTKTEILNEPKAEIINDNGKKIIKIIVKDYNENIAMVL
jgi:hypothetical protein